MTSVLKFWQIVVWFDLLIEILNDLSDDFELSDFSLKLSHGLLDTDDVLLELMYEEDDNEDEGDILNWFAFKLVCGVYDGGGGEREIDVDVDKGGESSFNLSSSNKNSEVSSLLL